MKTSKTFWDKQAKKFSDGGQKESDKLVSQSKEFLTSESKVLDFACGTGQSTALLASHADEVIGIDYSEEMIRYAKEKAAANASFLVGSLDHSELEKGSFDVITAFNVLHLLEDVEKQIQLIHDLLKPGGVFISYTACIGEKRTFMVGLIKLFSKLGFFPKVNALSVSHLNRLTANMGFEKLDGEITGDAINNYFLVLKRGD